LFAGYFPAKHHIELVDAPEPVLERASPEPGQPGEIIFQPDIACLCGSDLPYFNAEHPEFTDRVVGHSLHEMTGTVVATNGKKFRPGDKVLAVPINQRGFFERYIVSEARAIPVDKRLARNRAFLAQPLGTVIYAIRKLPQVLDKDVVVIGQGPIGQMFNACLRNLGARNIIAVERLPSRLALSSKMGANATIDPNETDVTAEVARITGGAMADIVVEAVGHADQVLNLALSLVKPYGRLMYFGVPPESIDAVRWRDAFMRNITIHTSVGPDFEIDFPLAMRWLAEGRLDLGPLVTHTYPLRDVQTAFETFRDRKDGAQKVVIEFPTRS
jgi:threonine dehydrogenase-like Zn-dependent dehydrogenase